MDEALLNRIALAFHDVKRPEDITKSVARELDDDCEVMATRCDELRASDPEKHWSDLPDDEIEAYDDIFPFLDAQGYHFYLPAYMSFAIRRHRDSDSAAIFYVVLACANGSGKFDLFTPSQMKCVFEFLSFCVENDGYFDGSWAAYSIDFLRLNAPPQAEQHAEMNRHR